MAVKSKSSSFKGKYAQVNVDSDSQRTSTFYDARKTLDSKVNKLKGLGGFLIIAGISFIALLNAQPHFTLAKKMAVEIKVFPFLDGLINLPFVGGWFAFLAINAVAVLGIILWGFTQYFQLLPLLVKRPSSRLRTYRAFAYLYETCMCFIQFPPYGNGVNDFLEDLGRWSPDLIDWWQLALFVVAIVFFELAVVTLLEVNKAFND